MFALEIFDASLTVGILIALSGGFVSFISPCVLPIVPAYLAYVSGLSFGEYTAGHARGTALKTAVGFVLGLSCVFLLLGIAATAFGIYFLRHQVLLGQIAGIVIVFFGFHFLGIFRLPILAREARLQFRIKGGNFVGAFVLGLAFAFGWTPCIGPVLGTVLSLAAQEESLVQGATLLAFYALGLGVPFILAAIFIETSINYMQKLKPWMGLIERATGLLLVAVGLLLVSGQFATISYWLLEAFPALALVG
ncbi:MAG: cytochrome c biogenesis protein CcdA [Rhodobacteraceae bacterium]|nr:cytochrome c biogenesis protein CcdA [Paracoccaceae bacterium]MCY4196913.1 cytochrome c biogenesis protein CcdA [Paracoccaceae bacterium]